jgi:hypothetical protein
MHLMSMDEANKGRLLLQRIDFIALRAGVRLGTGLAT